MLRFFFILFLSLTSNAFSIESDHVAVSISTVQSVSTSSIRCSVRIKVPENWKIAKPPEVTSESDGFVKLDEVSKIDNSAYECAVILSKKAQNVNLVVDLAACSDICVFLKKNINLNMEDLLNKMNDNHKFSFLYIIFCAVLGGLILNCMPCVLPVLMIKLRSFGIKTSNLSKNANLYTFAGIFSCFIVLAICVIILKSIGTAVGWGMHFQSAYFLNTAALAVFIFALFAYERLRFNVYSEGQKIGDSVFVREFSAGVLSTILAIPCTAPFLGTAATFALDGEWYETIFIFTAIAIGFGLPYLVVHFVNIPSFIHPGTWMNKLKGFLNLGICTAFLWLFWLLSNHLNLYFLLLLIILYCIVFVSAGKYRIPFISAAMLILFVPFFASQSRIDTHGKNNAISENWESFSQEKIDDYISSGKVIFVKITADWCMTCQYNKAFMLKTPSFKNLIKENHVILMEGDITYHDENIRDFLVKHKQSGIPFNIIFGPGTKNGIILSTLPTLSEIKDAITKAQKR